MPLTNNIKKHAIASLGYQFVKPEFLPEGENEYYLRNLQNRNGITYRQLTAYEIEVLVRNRNTSDNWNNLLVSDAFNPELVKNCKFFGLVRIGKLEPLSLEFSDLIVPVGLYNSTIISCDFGDNVVIDNVNYLSHYIIGSEVIVVNVNELITTDYAKFGIGILKEGEKEEGRIWLELCNENGGRKIIPFNGMLPGDAYMWTRFRNDEVLLERFKEFTEKEFQQKRGYYGKIGNRTIIKNCSIIKDVRIGEDAYLKGANKLKNLTINSGPEGKTQIGEGCELVNGIIGFGCRIFYGVKAVRFIMASHSQLKYGARLINSYLGNNATISCCEVLNTLIFPAHEQHHNNSFLCAALVMGQSNIAAGATIGSNHNSRSADGELIAGRGFWPGLCVSLKHNSKFASYTMIAKGDYPAEINLPFPFSLISNNTADNELVIMPAYWFLYNMYALQRNAKKYIDRDKRKEKFQYLEYDHLAPDTINEMVNSLKLLELFTGQAFAKTSAAGITYTHEELTNIGRQLLTKKDPVVESLTILAEGFENSRRNVVITKAYQAYHMYIEMITYYTANLTMDALGEENMDLTALKKLIPAKNTLTEWVNVGGQLMPLHELDLFKEKIKSNKINSWGMVHDYYRVLEQKYPKQKLLHALAALKQVVGIDAKKMTADQLHNLFDMAFNTKHWITKAIYTTREKDYTNTYRQMVYESVEEMNAVIGNLEDNTFIKEQTEDLRLYKKKITALKKKMKAIAI